NIKDELGKSIGLPLFDQWALFPLIADNAVLGILRVDLDNKNELMQEKGFDFNEVKLYADEATRILSNMLPRKKRIKDIQKDLESSLKAIQKHGYDRVRLYGVSLDGTRLYGLKEVGGTPGRFESLEFFINTDRYSYDSCIVKKEPIIYHGDFGKCSWTDIIGENKEWIEIPILDENRLIGKLSIDNQNSKKLIQLESIKKIDYIIKSISGLLKQLGLPDIRDTSDRHAIIRLDQLDAVNTKIISASDREKSLNIIIEKIMEFSGATSAYIRFLEGNELRMGPGKGDVYTAVTNIISLDDPDSLSASAIRTKKPQIHPKANEDESLQKMHERQAINPDAIEILKQQKSIGCFPLEFAGEMQGVLAIHSKLRQEFFDENVNELLNLLGERAAILIRDERIARAAEEKEKKYHAELLRTRQLASIGQLAAAVAHEINNPLNFITVIAQDILIDLEEKGSYPIEKLRQDMTRVKEVIDWISYYIVAQLRDIAKDRPTKLEPADINVVIRDSFMLFRRQLDTWHIKVNLDGLLSVSPILADAGKLKQVFINLITNSRDALDKCEDGVIKVITYDTNDSVVISFSDNGAGITDKNITKIFDPFFSTKEYGVGLGLSIVKEIVESFNGVIKLENQLGEGTNFIIIFPK
ncbi:MAG: ATP-binding protein, partial [Proteobacteria bacterium]|nr:ATP-binding protein [Pseudomonadota bacterium]